MTFMRMKSRISGGTVPDPQVLSKMDCAGR